MGESAHTKKGRPAGLTDKRIATILERLADGKAVRRVMPVWGRVHIDRQLPFLCVYRRPPGHPDPGTDRLVVSEAAYLLAPGDRQFRFSISRLVEQLAILMIDRFGACLVLELWSEDGAGDPGVEIPPRPGFRIHHSKGLEIPSTIKVLQERLMRVRAAKQRAEVATRATGKIAPPGSVPLLPAKRLRELGGYLLGLGVKPVYVNPETREIYPVLLRAVRRQLNHVLTRTFYEFARERTTHRPRHFHALGRRAVVKAVWDVDRRLAEVSNSFDLLYDVTPVNVEQAWKAFQRKRFEKAPVFLYRPSSIDPGLMKRLLYDIPIGRVEDPTLMHLFLDKQMELDRQLTMLHDLNTKRFLYESLQLHGDVSPPVVEVALEILDRTPSRSLRGTQDGVLTATEFAERARAEVIRYAGQYPEFNATVKVSDDIYSGLLVSRGELFIGKETRIPSHRADALLQHEVGTHLLTYFNGQAQPFRMLYAGLPGYEEMQEGLAVLSEHLVGGLTAERLRVLAARVVAARALIDGAAFVDVFRLLERTHRFSQQTAYTITMRLFRGGGLMKDAVYLRGLLGILKYLADSEDLDTLFIGKIAQSHVGVIEELLMRKILKPAPVYPRYLEREGVRVRLEKLRGGLSVLDLLTP